MRADDGSTINRISAHVHKVALARGFYRGTMRTDTQIACLHRFISNAFGHVKKAGQLRETRVSPKGRRYGFGVDLARAMIQIMDICAANGVDIGDEILAELKRGEERAKRTNA